MIDVFKIVSQGNGPIYLRKLFKAIGYSVSESKHKNSADEWCINAKSIAATNYIN